MLKISISELPDICSVQPRAKNLNSMQLCGLGLNVATSLRTFNTAIYLDHMTFAAAYIIFSITTWHSLKFCNKLDQWPTIVSKGHTG